MILNAVMITISTTFFIILRCVYRAVTWQRTICLGLRTLESLIIKTPAVLTFQRLEKFYAWVQVDYLGPGCNMQRAG